MQLTFGDAEQQGRRKRTRREVLLAEMEEVVPWKSLLKLIEPHYPTTGRPGRQPYPLETMLRIHLLQQWYALSDPAMEEALCGEARSELMDKIIADTCPRLLSPVLLDAQRWHGIWARFAAPGLTRIDAKGYRTLYR